MSGRLVDIYPYTLCGNDIKFLVFRRSYNVMYANQWRMIGGKVKKGEHRKDAALRELLEETGCVPSAFWIVPGINQFYESSTDTIHHIAAFAACLNYHDTIRLNHEHISYEWITKQNVKKFIKWPEQVRLLYLIHDILTESSVLPEWRISLEN